MPARRGKTPDRTNETGPDTVVFSRGYPRRTSDRVDWGIRTGQRRLGQHATLYVADILIHTAVPHHAENITDALVPNVFKKPDVTAQLENVIALQARQITAAVMSKELLFGLLGEPK